MRHRAKGSCHKLPAQGEESFKPKCPNAKQHALFHHLRIFAYKRATLRVPLQRASPGRRLAAQRPSRKLHSKFVTCSVNCPSLVLRPCQGQSSMSAETVAGPARSPCGSGPRITRYSRALRFWACVGRRVPAKPHTSQATSNSEKPRRPVRAPNLNYGRNA